MAKRARFSLLETIPEKARFTQLENRPRMSKVHSAARRAQLNLAPTNKERGPQADLKLCRAPGFEHGSVSRPKFTFYCLGKVQNSIRRD